MVKYQPSKFPDKYGFYGKFGGRFLSPEMNAEFEKIDKFYQKIRNDAEFINELKYIRKHKEDLQIAHLSIKHEHTIRAF